MSDRDFQAAAEFAVPFTTGLVALRHAAEAGEAVTLTAEEVKALIEALRMLRPVEDTP